MGFLARHSADISRTAGASDRARRRSVADDSRSSSMRLHKDTFGPTVTLGAVDRSKIKRSELGSTRRASGTGAISDRSLLDASVYSHCENTKQR